MDNQTKQKIDNIIKLVKKNKSIKKELNSLDDYKNKIEKVRKYYVRDTKSRGRAKSE
jgi:hypothetical protein